MAQPARFDIVIYIGDTFSLTVLFTDEAGTAIDISGYSFAAEVRAPGDGSLVATITAAVADGPDGEASLQIAAATTADLTPAVCDWDLQQTVGGVVTTLLRGRATITKDVTA